MKLNWVALASKLWYPRIKLQPLVQIKNILAVFPPDYRNQNNAILNVPYVPSVPVPSDWHCANDTEQQVHFD